MVVDNKSTKGGLLRLRRVSFDTVEQEGNIKNIFDAAREGHLDIVRCLVEKGADFNVMNGNGDYPLHLAVSNDHLEIVKYLVEKGADFNVMNGNGDYSLHLAILKDHLEIVKYLIEKGADFNIKNKSSNTPLHWSAQIGRLGIVKYFVEKGADFNVKNSEGLTSLQEATRNGHLSTVRYLVEEKHADFNVKDNGGNTPLHDAAGEGYLNVVKYLVEKGANLNIKSNDNKTPLQFAEDNGKSDVVKYLRKKSFSNSNIFDAAKSGNLDAVKYFVEDKKVDVNVKDNDGKTPLHWAAWNGHLGVVKYLVDQKNADITSREKDNGIPLHWAASNGQLDIVKYFIDEKHIDINIRGYVGNTVLHYAVLGRKPNTVKWLLDSGAGVNIKNDVGNTPLVDAINFNSGSDIINYLLNVGAKRNRRSIESEDLSKEVKIVEQREVNDLSSIKGYYGKISSDLAKDQDVKGYLELMNHNRRSVDSSETTSDITHQLDNGKKAANSFGPFLFAQANSTENTLVSSDQVRASSWINGFIGQIKEVASGFNRYRQQNTTDYRIRYRRHKEHGDLDKKFSESITSSSARPSLWTNDLFNWVKSSIDELLSSNITSSISQIDQQIDVDDAIMLLDLLIRRVTGQKYISSADQHISLIEAQGYALNITNELEKVLNETAIKSGISVTNLNFDPVTVQSAIVGQVISKNFSKISKSLYSFAKEACPEFKQTDKFLAHLKSNLEGEKETVLLQQKVEKPSKILDQQVSGKVELSNKPDTFLNSTSVVRGISRGIN